MPKLEPIVNQEPKDQLVPTFNKKEVAEIAQDANVIILDLSWIFPKHFPILESVPSEIQTGDFELDEEDQKKLISYFQIFIHSKTKEVWLYANLGDYYISQDTTDVEPENRAFSNEIYAKPKDTKNFGTFAAGQLDIDLQFYKDRSVLGGVYPRFRVVVNNFGVQGNVNVYGYLIHKDNIAAALE